MRQIVHILVISLIAIIISFPLIAGGHKYIAYPVIFVHGFNSDMTAWKDTKSALEGLYKDKYGYKYDPTKPNDQSYFPLMNYGVTKTGEFSKNGDCTRIANYSSGGLLGLKQVIDNAIEYLKNNQVPPEERKVIIVAHSFGGIVTRRLLKEDLSMKDKIAKVIFLDTPQAGSPLASALYMLNQIEKDIALKMDTYLYNSTNIGFRNNYSQNKAAIHYSIITTKLLLFQSRINSLLELSYLVGPDPRDRAGYDTAIKQLRLNQDVSFWTSFSGLPGMPEEVISLTTHGQDTFLGKASTNLDIPNKFDVIYSDLNSDWINLNPSIDPFCRLASKIHEFLFDKYFIFPPGESLLDLLADGDSIVTCQSAQAIGGTPHPIKGYSHVQETSQWETIKKVLCEDPPDTVFTAPSSTPSANVSVYTTRLRVEGKIRDYLPIDNTIKFILNNHKDVSFDYPERKDKDPDTKFDLNSDYNEAGPDNYQGTYTTLLNLFPFNNQAYDSGFTLYAKAVNPGGKESALKDINFTYTCLVSTATTPANNEQNVPLDKEVKIVFKEKTRRETFIPQNISFTGGNVSVLYDTTWLDEKTVQLSPYGPLSPDTAYTITLTGDKPNTYDIDYPTTTIEGIQYYLSDSSVSDDNADKHGFDPWGLPSVNLRNSQLVRIIEHNEEIA